MRLVTRRLVLRMGRETDIPEIIEYFRRNRDHLAPWDPKRNPDFYTAASWRRQLRRNIEEAREDRSLRLFLFQERRVIGTLNFSNFVRGTFQSCNVGYAIDAAEVGRGLMTEAMKAAIAHAFGPLHMHRIMANYLPGNRRSGKLLKRLGFRIEGVAKEYLRIAGRWRDHVLTSLINRKWRPEA